MQVNIHDAKTQLSQLIKKCEEGEEIIIARKGTPVIKLVSLNEPERKLGFFDCEVDMTGFDEPIPGMEDYMPNGNLP